MGKWTEKRRRGKGRRKSGVEREGRRRRRSNRKGSGRRKRGKEKVERTCASQD